VKYRFFKHLKNGDDPSSEELYRWHIQKRTGGIEPRSWKRTIKDYVQASVKLLRSMEAGGFDASHPVIIGSNGWLKDGAHRTACSLFFDIPVTVRKMSRPGTARWGADWFLDRGMSPDQIKELARQCENLRSGRGENA
jgi:hypothetical protein